MTGLPLFPPLVVISKETGLPFVHDVLQGPTLQSEHLHHGDKVPAKILEESFLETLEYLSHSAMFSLPVLFPSKSSTPSPPPL